MHMHLHACVHAHAHPACGTVMQVIVLRSNMVHEQELQLKLAPRFLLKLPFGRQIAQLLGRGFAFWLGSKYRELSDATTSEEVSLSEQCFRTEKASSVVREHQLHVHLCMCVPYEEWPPLGGVYACMCTWLCICTGESACMLKHASYFSA